MSRLGDNSESEGRYAIVKTTLKDIFGKRARMGFLVNLINKSIELKLYAITYEVTKRFMSDFLKSR
jgi:hypothetical protein